MLPRAGISHKLRFTVVRTIFNPQFIANLVLSVCLSVCLSIYLYDLPLYKYLNVAVYSIDCALISHVTFLYTRMLSTHKLSLCIEQYSLRNLIILTRTCSELTAYPVCVAFDLRKGELIVSLFLEDWALDESVAERVWYCKRSEPIIILRKNA